MRTRGAVIEGWDRFDAHSLYGAKPAAMQPRTETTMNGGDVDRSMSSGLIDQAAEVVWHPDNPLFWFALVAGVTFGLIGFSTSARLGPFRAGISAGNTK